MATDKSVWNGRPSQVLNLPLFVVCFLFCWLVVPIFIAIWKWLVLRNVEYELTTERLKLREGVFNKSIDELELYRVHDYKLDKPFWQRIFSLGTITLKTADESNPVVVLKGVRESERVFELLRTYVEECRVKKRVLPLDLQQA